ncbi:hypothetical protein [Actinomadura rupiterrae]|uniref:hypothetical protein n=1 Tax=Actinomadura rupiterrae TaxID=559627 RepID=UPI0020A42E31|nr:hypothetical protein [Actinomadura rupiterrae]MCP2340191.1 hypothetical protein [Actinomadura rupiterrae]
MLFTRTRRDAPTPDRPPFTFPTAPALTSQDDQAATITPRLRRKALAWASAITTDRTDDNQVLGHAEVILAWLEVADTADDLSAREAALTQAGINHGYPHDGDTDRFLGRARSLYGFLTDTYSPAADSIRIASRYGFGKHSGTRHGTAETVPGSEIQIWSFDPKQQNPHF